MAVTPMAALASRRRTRAVVAGTVCGVALGGLVGGTTVATNLILCAALGWAIGNSLSRRRGVALTVAHATMVTWPPVAAISVGSLLVLSKLRRLTLEQIVISWRGTARVLRSAGFEQAAANGDRAVRWMVTYWWVTVPAALLVLVLGAAFIAQAIARPAVRRLEAALGPAGERTTGDGEGDGGNDDVGGEVLMEPATATARIAPVPVELVDVAFRYPHATHDAVAGLTVRADAGELVALVGPNGSGKSTLARLLAGMPPTAGVVRRAGAAGLGRYGGTAVIHQQPDSQVLGVRVRDDVVWGLPSREEVDVDSLLDRVGLTGMAERETSTLSGGELQRLAVAAALARRPALLVSDEATAMVDATGRVRLVQLLRDLAAAGTCVVHATHDPDEVAGADRTIVLAEAASGQPDVGPASAPERCRSGRPLPAGGAPLVRLEQAGYVYAPGSPWAHRALAGVDLTIAEGDGILVVGRNGSGKTTLAWMLAGLLAPTEGTAWLGSQPLVDCVGQVGLSFQHARLQLLRPTVGSDVRAAAATDEAGMIEALAAVGLEAGLASRRIDQLSGGQQRRVALAGLLARRPRLLVLDEPFAGLDRASRAALADVVAGLRRRGIAVVLVSHDVDAAAVTERVLVLDGGRVVAQRPARGLPSLDALLGSAAVEGEGGSA